MLCVFKSRKPIERVDVLHLASSAASVGVSRRYTTAVSAANNAKRICPQMKANLCVNTFFIRRHCYQIRTVSTLGDLLLEQMRHEFSRVCVV